MAAARHAALTGINGATLPSIIRSDAIVRHGMSRTSTAITDVAPTGKWRGLGPHGRGVRLQMRCPSHAQRKKERYANRGPRIAPVDDLLTVIWNPAE